jgi:hypothetical protein
MSFEISTRPQAPRSGSQADATRHPKLLFLLPRRSDGRIDLLGPQPAAGADRQRQQTVQAQKNAGRREIAAGSRKST